MGKKPRFTQGTARRRARSPFSKSETRRFRRRHPNGAAPLGFDPRRRVRCPYCGGKAEYHPDSKAFYHGRDYGPLWACSPCGAWVGVHRRTNEPLGELADRETRQARMDAHDAFDPLWQSGRMSRGEAYLWLQEQLGLTPGECHIGRFTVEQCQAVVRAVASLGSWKLTV